MMQLEASQPPTLKIEVTHTALILSLILYMCEVYDALKWNTV